MDIRQRFQHALQGEPIGTPIYAVYDWFVKNRPDVDWPALFEAGLGIIGHADVIRVTLPSVRIIQTTTPTAGGERRDVRWVTDTGELHEWYLGEWRQEYLIKSPRDYRIMLRALEGVTIEPDSAPWRDSEQWIGPRGITLGQIAGIGRGRTPLMVLQIDWVGLEQFSLDLADELAPMMDLLRRMNELKLQEIAAAAAGPATHVKLWENLSINTLGDGHYRHHLAPLYGRIIDLLHRGGKRLVVHYDGQLRVIRDCIADLDFDGIDSLTEAPEGDMTVAEARAAWPDKFLWVHPNLNWYLLPPAEFQAQVRRVIHAAGPTRYCLMISEEVPPDWKNTVPALLNGLSERS